MIKPNTNILFHFSLSPDDQLITAYSKDNQIILQLLFRGYEEFFSQL